MSKLDFTVLELLKIPQQYRLKIYAIVSNNPDMSQSDIARAVGCSREYVRQVLGNARHGYKKINYSFCEICGIKLSKFKAKVCINCYKKTKYSAEVIKLTCETCGIVVTSKLQQNSYRKEPKHVWCSKKCHGVWLGKHYGHSRCKASLVIS